MALDPGTKKVVTEGLANWMEIQDRRKELSAENSQIVETVANALNVKKPVVSKMFKVLRRKMEDGENELDELNDLIAEVES